MCDDDVVLDSVNKAFRNEDSILVLDQSYEKQICLDHNFDDFDPKFEVNCFRVLFKLNKIK